MTTRSDVTTTADTGRSVATSGAAQFAARLIDVATTWLLSILVLRHLGPAGFGDYALIAGLAGLVGVFSEFGLPRVATREITNGAAAEPAGRTPA